LEEEMVDTKKAGEALQKHVNPATFPVAVKMLENLDNVPEKTRFPMKSFGQRFSLCQAWNMSRRTGWSICCTPEDMQCSLGSVAMGFGEPIEFYSEGHLCEAMYTETAEAGKKTEAETDKMPVGKYAGVLFAALARATFEPDVVIVYGNSAQVMRLVQATLFKRGGRLTSSFGGRMDCSELIVTPMDTNQPQVILPCYGDRIFGQTQDHEMAFAAPWSWMEGIIAGLEGTHKGGVRYPIPSFLNYEAKFPPKYVQLAEMWKDKTD
jgi:uncharacterized protein (DUF169 family)